MLHCSGAFAQRHQLLKSWNTWKQTRVEFFYPENMTSFLNYVTAMLRAVLRVAAHLSSSHTIRTIYQIPYIFQIDTNYLQINGITFFRIS